MRFPGFTDEWKTTKLKTYLVENKERNAKGKFSKEQVLSVSGDKGVVNQIELLGRSYAGQSVLPYHVVYHSDIVYTKSPLSDFPYGIVKMNRGVDGVVSTLYAVYSVLGTAHPSFIEYYFASKNRTNRFFKPIVRIGAKHDMKIGNSEVLANEVTFPDIDEQIRISKFLELIDERIATQNKIIDNLQSLIKGLAKTHYDSCDVLQQVKIIELGEPYSVMNLSKEQLSDNGQPCILYGELFTQYGPVIESIYSKTNVESNLSLSNGRDLLFPSSTTVDALSLIAPSALTKPNIILGGDMFGIKVANEYSPEYLSYYFNYIGNHELAKYAIGSTIIHLHYKDIAEHTIAVPTLRNQLSFVKLASTMKSKIENEKYVLHNLKTLKAYLLQAMFI